MNREGGEKAMSEHSEEQGLRVHHLANLGGLVALAELDREPPDFLLGALISVAHERERLSAEQRTRVAALGRAKLDERATAKRAWKSWRRAQDLHALTLTSAQLRRLITALGGQADEDSAQLIRLLAALLKEQADGVAAVATPRE